MNYVLLRHFRFPRNNHESLLSLAFNCPDFTSSFFQNYTFAKHCVKIFVTSFHNWWYSWIFLDANQLCKDVNYNTPLSKAWEIVSGFFSWWWNNSMGWDLVRSISNWDNWWEAGSAAAVNITVAVLVVVVGMVVQLTLFTLFEAPDTATAPAVVSNSGLELVQLRILSTVRHYYILV